MALSQEGTGSVRLGGATVPVTQYLAKLDVGGVAGIFASLIGKDPPDLRYWLVPGDVPVLVRFEGSMYLNGPTWRIQQATVEWSKE